MPGMPYHLEKGPLLSVLDSFCNTGSTQRLTTALVQLRNGASLPQIGVFDSPNLYSNAFQYPFRNRDELVAHFNDHWLGIPPGTDPWTGHWRNYKGPVALKGLPDPILLHSLRPANGQP